MNPTHDQIYNVSLAMGKKSVFIGKQCQNCIIYVFLEFMDTLNMYMPTIYLLSLVVYCFLQTSLDCRIK